MMRITTPSAARLLAALPILLVVGCDSGGGGSGGGGDGPGDCPAFTEITGVGFTRTADQLEWTLSVRELPDMLTFNRSGVPEFVLEYSWAVRVDSEGDGTEDYVVGLKHFASGEEVTDGALGQTLHRLWSVEGAANVEIGSIEAAVSGSTFTFTVDAAEDAGLAAVTESSEHVFETRFHVPDSGLCGDEHVGLQ